MPIAAILPTPAYGDHRPGDWISRYCRFRADLPAGRHRLLGAIYNPNREELAGNSLLVAVNRAPVGKVEALGLGESRFFSFDLAELEAPGRIEIMLRTSRFRVPPPPDVRLLGLVLRELRIEPGADPPQP